LTTNKLVYFFVSIYLVCLCWRGCRFLRMEGCEPLACYDCVGLYAFGCMITSRSWSAAYVYQASSSLRLHLMRGSTRSRVRPTYIYIKKERRRPSKRTTSRQKKSISFACSLLVHTCTQQQQLCRRRLHFLFIVGHAVGVPRYQICKPNPSCRKASKCFQKRN
jgi:hypothetical protein